MTTLEELKLAQDELADTQDLGSCAERCEGSTPSSGTPHGYASG